MIKLIATDLDGTLLYPKKRFTGICKANKEFLSTYTKNGGELVLVSGRSISIVHKLEKKIGTKLDFIGCNGAFIYKNKVTYDPKPLDKKIILDIFTKCNNSFSIFNWVLFDDSGKMYNLLVDKFSRFTLIVKVVNFFRGFYNEPMSFNKDDFIHFINNSTIYKIMMMFGITNSASQTTSEALVAFNQRYGDKVELASSNNVIEITAKGVTKGNELELYCKEFNIKKDEVIVVGDSGNDITMFNKFPHSFAMNHAEKEVIAHANHKINLFADLKHYLENESLLEGDEIILDKNDNK